MRQGGDEVRPELLMGEWGQAEGYGLGGLLWPSILKMSYHLEIRFSFNNLNYFEVG